MAEKTIRVIHTDSRSELELQHDNISFYVDGKLHRFGDLRQAILAIAVAEVFPACLKFDRIANVLREKGRNAGGFNNDFTLNLSYVRKKVMEANSAIKSATGSTSFLESVRGEGYILSAAWSVSNLDPLEQAISQDIGILQKLVASCIEVVHSSDFSVDLDGIKTAVVDRSVVESIVTIYAEMRTRIYGALASKRQLTSDIVSLLQLMESYVSFSRSGKDISDEAWKNAFNSEIVSVYHAIVGHLVQSEVT